MCLYTNEENTARVIKGYTPDDWLYGYKRFVIRPDTNEVITPYQDTVVDLNNQKFESYSSLRIRRGKEKYNEGIHFYQNNDYCILFSTDEVLVKVYAQVKDIIALGEIDVVARRIIIDKADLDMMKKKLAQKRAAWEKRVSQAKRPTVNGYYPY